VHTHLCTTKFLANSCVTNHLKLLGAQGRKQLFRNVNMQILKSTWWLNIWQNLGRCSQSMKNTTQNEHLNESPITWARSSTRHTNDRKAEREFSLRKLFLCEFCKPENDERVRKTEIHGIKDEGSFVSKKHSQLWSMRVHRNPHY